MYDDCLGAAMCFIFSLFLVFIHFHIAVWSNGLPLGQCSITVLCLFCHSVASFFLLQAEGQDLVVALQVFCVVVLLVYGIDYGPASHFHIVVGSFQAYLQLASAIQSALPGLAYLPPA